MRGEGDHGGARSSRRGLGSVAVSGRSATAFAALAAALARRGARHPCTRRSRSGQAWGSAYIVSDPTGSAASALAAVARVGGAPSSSLPLIGGVTVQLDARQVSALRALPSVVVTPDVTVKMQGQPESGASPGFDGSRDAGPGPASSTPRAPAAVFPHQTGADTLWARGDNGSGVNVALLDTGITGTAGLRRAAGRRRRPLR